MEWQIPSTSTRSFFFLLTPRFYSRRRFRFCCLFLFRFPQIVFVLPCVFWLKRGMTMPEARAPWLVVIKPWPLLWGCGRRL